MTTSGQEQKEGRGIGRRKEDFIMRGQVHQYKQIYHVGQIITSEINMDVLFELIIDQTNQIMGTERSSVFLYNEKTTELWSLVATGMEKNKIRIPSDYGIAGSVFQARLR